MDSCARGQTRVALILAGGLAQGRAQYLARARLLHKGHDAQVFRILAGPELQLNILGKNLPFGQLPYSLQLLHDGDVHQVACRHFSAQDLRLHVIESERHEELGVVLGGVSVGFNVRLQGVRISRQPGDLTNPDGNLGRGFGVLQRFLKLSQVAQARLAGAVDNELRSVGAVDS